MRMHGGLRRVAIPLLGLLLMVGSTLLYVRFLRHYRTTLTTMETVKPVRLLQAGEQVREDLLRRVSIPIAAHDAEAAVSAGSLIGKTVLVPIGPNEELAAWKLADGAIVAAPDERYYAFKTDKLENGANLVRCGDRVDVWVELDSPVWLRDESGARQQVGSIKLIENLLVAGVKTAEGAEVADSAGLTQVLTAVRGNSAAGSEAELIRSRASPNGVPELNLYLMREEVYNAYTLGSLGGKIKLALADRNRLPGGTVTTRLTEMYDQLQESDLFNKDKKPREVTVNRIEAEQVTGKRTSGEADKPVKGGGE